MIVPEEAKMKLEVLSVPVIVRLLVPAGLKLRVAPAPVIAALLPRKVTFGVLTVTAELPPMVTVCPPANVIEPPAFCELRVIVPEAPALSVGLPVNESVFAAPLAACSTIVGAPAPVPLNVPLPLICKLPVLVIDRAPELPVALIVLLLVTVPPLRTIVVLAPDIMLPAVTLPVGVSVRVPVDEMTFPDVLMFAEAPVVVMEKVLPTVEVDSVTEPALVIKAVPAPPELFAERFET